MQFMTRQEAEALAARIKQEAPDISVREIFPASELKINADQYPEGSYLVDIVEQLKEGGSIQNWIQSSEHWEAIKAK